MRLSRRQLCVLGGSAVKPANHHRDAEDAEVAQTASNFHPL